MREGVGLGDGAGAFMNPAQATAATQFVRALGKGSAHPNLRAELAGTALRIFGGGASAGASAYSHLSFLQANDAPVTDEDKLAQTLTSALFGAISGGASSIRPIRRAIMADKELARFRAAIPQPPPQPGPSQSPAAPTPPVLPPGPADTPPNQPGRGAAPHQPNQASRAGATRQTFHGQPQSPQTSGGEAASPAWASVDRLLPTGDVLFRDGSRYRPDTGDYLMPNGAVVSPDGTLLTVAGPADQPPAPAAPNGAPDSRSTIPDSPGGQSPASPAAPVRALSLYRLLQASDAQVHNVPLADIQVNVDVKQFKSGADPRTGVVAGEELHGEFQKIPAKPIVLLRKRDGTLEVVTGRHRLDLARRNGLETIPANIIREADGWTPKTAALLDAFDNILDEKGSYADYVPFFRNAGIPRDVAEAYGLLARPKGRLSFDIAMNACDDLVSFVQGGDKRITPDVAAAICRAVPLPPAARQAGTPAGQAARHDAIQHHVIQAVIDEGLRADQAEIMANGLRAEYAKRAEAKNLLQDDLFGFDETFNTEMALRAKYAGDQLAKINLDLRALKIVSGKQSGNVAAKDSLLKKHDIQGPDDAPGIERAIQELETLHHRWRHYYTDAELSKEADAFVKKSLRLDPEDQPPIPLDPKGNPITPESAPVSAAEQPPTQSATADELPLGNAASDARQGVPESPASPESPAPSGEAAPAQPLPEVPHESSDEQVNGTGFQALRQGEGFETIKLDLGKRTKESFVNKTLNVSSTIGSAHNASRLTVANRTGGEDANAHRYAAKNVKALYENARIAVRHLDKNHVGQRGKNAPHYLRLFSPFVYEGNLYVAIISQRDVDNQSPGVHAIEALEVLKAEDASAFTSWPDRDTVRSSLTDASSRGKDESRLTEDKIAYTIDESKLDPRHLDGTAYSEAELMRDIRADLAGFVGRARYRADHKLQPIDADDVGRFTMGEGVTIEVSDNTATVAGLAGKSPDEAAKLLDAIQAQLPPNVSITTDAQSPARRPEGAPPESPASPESPARPSGGEADAPLANQAPGTQGSQAPAQTGRRQPAPNRPQSAESAVPPDVPNLQSAGADIVSAAVYPNGGRVPVAGSPAAAAGTLPLSLPHAVQLFHLLTGKLPGIVAQKNRGPRNALGWFLPKTGDAFVRAQLFGLIDQSDLTVLKDALAKRGFFRHENPAWCVTQTKDSIRREKALSNQKLAKAADLLIRRRTRAGVHQGAAAKVMAHELWHAISASGGVPPRDHGNLLGQIYNLKKCMAKALPENAFATDDALRQEAKDFIAWWRGTGKHEPYFDQPHEAYAEMGAAFFLDPEAVKERAPTYYDAMLDGLRNYPQAFDALAAIRDQRAAGGDLDAFQRRLQTTWQAAHEARVRKLRDEVGKPTRDERKARIVQLYWNRHAPVMMILQRAQKDVRARLRQDLKDGNITQADHDAKIKELDEEQLDVRHHTLLFTHRHGPSKLFLADIWGRIGQQAKELGVSMNDLNLYLHLRRVEELKGRATALGIDPPTARAMLNQFFKRLGYAKVRAIARLAKTFHAVWQHSILENPDVIAMLGPDKIAELKQNAHYITMRHVPTPEELQAATVAWEKTKRAKSGGDPLDPIVRELLGHKAYTSGVYGANAHTGVASALKRLQGSLRQTESPLTATAETGLAILEAAQRNALTVSLVRALKAVDFDEIAVLKPTDDVITNDRIGTVQYMENGKRVTLAAPRSVVDALSGAPHEIPYLTAATRFLSAGFTTNNPAFIIPAALRDLDSLYVQMPGMKRGFAQWCAAYANLIPGVGPLRHARAAVNLGNWVNWSAQFIPPHVMKRISQTPIGRLLYGQNTVAYWTSVGAKIARIIQHMDFEGTLRQAHEARLAGDDAKAEALEYCATMARHALEDGVLLTYNQQLADDYLKGGLQRLFDKYHLKYDDDRRHLPIPAKIAKRAQDYRETLRQRLLGANAIQDPKKRMAALAAVAASPLADLYRTTVWDSAGFLSEYQSMMVKLAGWAYLHHESAAGNLPPLPADPASTQSGRRQPAPNRPQSAESAVPQSGSPGGEAANDSRFTIHPPTTPRGVGKSPSTPPTAPATPTSPTKA